MSNQNKGDEAREMNEVIERLQYIADSPDKEHGGFHPEVRQTAKDAIALHTAAMSELADLKAFVASLNSLAFEEWYGCYYGYVFLICDGDGNTVGEGMNALEAWQNMNPQGGGSDD